MSKIKKVYYDVLISSPNDVKKERKLMINIRDEVNSIIKYFHKSIQLVKWETDTHSSIGEYAQGIVTKQLGSDFDIYVGIMGTNIGTKTKKAVSGTVEEFNNAYKLYLKNKKKVNIKFYFSDIKMSPSKIDCKQFQKVKDFKKYIQTKKEVLTEDYTSYREFERKVRDALRQRIYELIDWKKFNPKMKIKKYEK